ncbi:DUF11 domain-containing protein [Photobacterium profundum]|uniref:DUF11 domain-containing protein n=1 Tax=Photobacterium profundum (strain SS9) TaxID=298386 RepID=Q6LT25_PHOPR|nr:DUF11 domain-containing protein [Photobacterium profundum]CAG19551.1 hypothetical protein PBPRA1140 [Photobacterium profundum SS9]
MNNGLAQVRFIPLCIFLLSVIFSGHVFAASSNVAISLSSTSAKYDNGDNIDYKLVVTNSARRGVESIEVKSDLLAVLADIDSGGKGNAFSSVSISAVASSAKSSAGNFPASGNLYAQNVTIAAGDTITYHLSARVADDVVGRIDASGSFITAVPHETIESNVVSVKRVKYDFSVGKTVVEGDFAPGEVITYQVHIDNNGASLIKGMAVADAVMAIQATSIDGLSVPAFSSTLITASKSGSLSNAGNFNSSGNLSATNVSIDTGGWVEYQIKATVALDIVSSIDNTAEATAHSVTNPSNTIVINPAKPNLSITKTVDKKNDYQVGDELTYTITASNSGRGIAYQYQVKDVISDISSLLANDASAKHDHTDVGANPFQSWTIKVASIGTNSQSALKLAGEAADVDLDDVVSISPNESIRYTIKAVTKSVSISSIDNIAQLNDSKGNQVATSDVATSTNLDVLDTALASKKTTATQYSPGQWVPYDITVENSDSTKFANNVTMVDNLTTCVQTEQADGSTSDAFSGWKVKSVEEIGEGTDAGLVANKTSRQSGDFEFVTDLAPNGKVVYHIEALVNENSVGHIHDIPGCDAIDESGSGLEMPKGKIQVKKTVDKTQFIPGDNLTYTITIENPAQGYVINVPIDDAISDVIASSVDGGDIKAFDSWTVTASATNNSGAATNPTKPDLDGSINDNADIHTHATIYPGDTVTYTVTAKTNVKVNGEIRNKVTAGDGGNSEVGSTPYIHDISISKNVDHGTYSNSENTFTYMIEVKNGDPAGFAKGVHVVDDIEGIRADLLEFGPAENPFESWEITAVAEGDEADSGMSGSVKDKNLDVKADIPARGKITYTVVAHLKERTQDHIIWGSFSNSANAKLEADDVTGNAVTQPKMPNLRVTKVVNQPYYVVGEEVTYTIVVENIGDGYANDTTVFDDIASLGLFDEWKIDYEKTGVGTRVDQKFKLTKTTENIDTEVDIAPHSAITFEVTGIVVDGSPDRGKITNTVKVHDNQNHREFDESADIDEPEKAISVSIDKYSEQVYYNPGQEHVYVVSVTNHSDKEMNDVSVVDDLSTMGVKTANDKDGHYLDANEGTAFESWGIERTIGSVSEQIIPPGSTTDLNDHITLLPGAEAVYRITTIVKDNVIEETLENIAYLNVVSIDRNGKEHTYEAFAKVQNHRAESGGVVVRKVSPAMYKPGDKITYTITASSSLGYFNDVAIQDEISKLSVKLLNGGEGNPFATYDDPTHPQFTVDVAIDDAIPKDGGSTDGTLDGVVKANTDLNTIIDVTPNDKVVYTITGTVRDDAIGKINNDGLIVKPYAAQIEYKKETVEANYAPGKTLEYLLTVENTGNAHAQDVNIEDAISFVEVTDVDNNQIKAFTTWTIEPEYFGDFKTFVSPGLYSDDHDLKTTADIPLGGKFVYHVTATVAETAAGDILNVLNVNGNTTSVTTRPETRQYDVSKEIVAYYDVAGDKLPNNNGYMPGGSIEYRIHIQNNSSSNIANIPVKDAIGSIETKYFDNTTDQVFTSWEITTEKDSGGVSNAGSTNDDHDIDTHADLGHDGFVDYIIKAKISDKAVGDFSNTVDVFGLKKTSPVSIMLPSKVTLTKAIFDSADKVISQYFPSQDVVYKIRLENNKQGTIYNQHLSDILSLISTNIAELSGTGKENPTANPFVLWSVSVDQSSGITNVGGFTGGDNVDIDTDIDIAPLGYIEFTVKATIRDTALGQITNTAHLKAAAGLSRDNRSLSATAVLDPQPKQVDHYKTIVSVGGATYSKDTHYLPGDEVEYKITVDNQSDGWANDITMKDEISKIMVELAGDKTETAFSSWVVTHVISRGLDLEKDTYLPNYSPTGNLDLEADIAPKEGITFTIKAQIKDNALGTVDANTAIIDSQNDTTDPITPQASSLEIHKAVDTETFIPGQTVNYTVTVTNTGDTWLNDVVIKDPISAITAEIAGSSATPNIGPAFSSSSLSVKQSESYVSANPDGSISAIADIKPGDTITFTIAAIVSDNVIGEISNTATADDIPSETVIIQPAPFDIEVTKTADTKEFVPGQLITYTVTVSNPTNSWANDVAISDEVSKIEAEIAHDSTAGSAVTGPAFDAATITVDIAKGTSFVDGTGENATADIAPNSNVVFTIKANVASNVVGEISNIANASDKSAEVVITPKTAIFTIIKSVDELTFIPGQVMTYSLVVENTTDAWANDVKITDDIAAINVEVAGGKTGPAFDISSLKVISGVVDGEGFVFANPDGSVSAMADIGPASKATVIFEATVAADVVGDIPNTAFANDIASEEVVITPKESTLEITKKVDAAEYVPGQELTYTVTVSNTSGSWANDIAIKDEVSKIQAEVAGGSASVPAIGDAFDVSSITFEDPVVINSIVAKITDETAKADIAPNESVIFVIKAKVADNVIGDITNTASASGQDASVVTPAAKSEVEITKISESKTYTDGGKVVYHIDVHNKSQSFANNIALTDEISNIVVDTNLGMSEPAFTDWKVEYKAGDSKTVVMANTRKIYHPANNSDIDAVMDIAPEDTVTFTVTATVQYHAISPITNTAVITDADGASQEDDAVVDPAPTSTRVSKVSVEEKYTPNQPLSFVLTIANTSSNYIDDLIVADDMSTIQVKYIDGTTGPAFIPGTISFMPKVVPAGSLTVKGSETSYKVDIAPKSTVTFDVIGTVNEHATSDIQNIAQLNDDDVKSNWVPTVAAKVKGTLTAVEEEYVPGNTIEYHLTLANDSDGIAKNVYLLTQFNKASGTYIDGHDDDAFDSWTIKAVTEGIDTTSGTFTDDSDIATSINIAPHGKVEYTIVATVNQDMLTPIDLRTFFLDSTINIPGTGAARQLAKQIEVGTSGKLEVLQIPPVGSKLNVVKTVEKDSYTDDDKTVQYQLSVNNTGGGNAPNVALFDDIAGLQNIKGIDVFTDWVITGREFEEGRLVDHFTIKGDQNNKNNLNVIKNMKSNGRNNIEMMIVATINKHLDDDITNVFKATEENGKVTQDEATTHIKKIPDNTGELDLTKRATKTDAQVGDVVEYEIIVDNNNESYFNNVVVDDRFPAGFQYVPDSTEMVLSGVDGEFETSDDMVVSAEPTLSGSLQFPQVDFDPYEKLRIRYLMRVSIGVTFGKYVNTAVAKVENSNVSNTGSATVEIEADKLFDTASIIGKVFEDLNGDGFQADATADDIELTTTLKPQDYIAGSTTLEVNGHTAVVDDENTVPAIDGIYIDELYGQSKNRTLKQSNKAYIQFKTRTMTPFLLVIETDNGTTITFDAQGKIQRHLEGDVKEELSAEDLNVTRNLYKAPDGYLWEIVIENLGVYEDGIPGARLITTEGIKIETDEYGRYHVPDQWVTDKKGRSFLVKLDSDSLPTGMTVISENPKVKRITPHALAKFNFSVQAKTSAGNSQKKKPISS